MANGKNIAKLALSGALAVAASGCGLNTFIPVPRNILPRTSLTTDRNEFRASRLEDVADSLYRKMGGKEYIEDGNTVYTTVERYQEVAGKLGVDTSYEKTLHGGYRLVIDKEGTRTEYIPGTDNSIDLGEAGVVNVCGRKMGEVRAEIKQRLGQDAAVNFNLAEGEDLYTGFVYFTDLVSGNCGRVSTRTLFETVTSTGIGADSSYLAVFRQQGGKNFVLFSDMNGLELGLQERPFDLQHHDIVLAISSRTDLQEFEAFLKEFTSLTGNLVTVHKNITYLNEPNK